MASRDPAEQDLRTLLDDLDRTLADLRDELRDSDGTTRRRGDATVDRRSGGRRDRRERPGPRPPSLSELVRFTEQYTLPTLIATLETAIQSLELLRGMLRLADPDRSMFDPDERGERSPTRLSDGVADVGRGAVTGVERALSELQTALSESDLPEDQPSRELLEDARRLSEEVSSRLAETARSDDAGRYGSRRDERASATSASDAADRERSESTERERSAGVEIDVTGEGGDRDGSGSGGSETHADPASAETPEVDVEAELASIKSEVEPRDARSDEGGDAESGDAESEDAQSDAGSGNAAESGDDGRDADSER